MPEGCRLRAPVLRAPVDRTVGFIAEPGSLGALLIAESSEDGAKLVASAAIRFDSTGAVIEQTAAPWSSPAMVPRVARTAASGWIGALTERDGRDAWQAVLWRGGALEVVGAGDHFEAIDLWCARDYCALLTPRLGRVTMPGAEVRLGPADAPVAAWTRIVVEPQDIESDAHPLGLIRPEAPLGSDVRDGGDQHPGGGAPRLAVLEKGACVIFTTAPEARELARLPAPHGVLDVIGIPEPTAMLHGAPVDVHGCLASSHAGAPAKVRFAQRGRESDVATPSPPRSGALRPLGRGALATWIAPLGCQSSRSVVYGVRIDGSGRPRGAVIPIGDAVRYAVASEGDDVDLWLQQLDAVAWLRLRCSE